jgi:hypothetical protein
LQKKARKRIAKNGQQMLKKDGFPLIARLLPFHSSFNLVSLTPYPKHPYEPFSQINYREQQPKLNLWSLLRATQKITQKKQHVTVLSPGKFFLISLLSFLVSSPSTDIYTLCPSKQQGPLTTFYSLCTFLPNQPYFFPSPPPVEHKIVSNQPAFFF